MNGVHIIRSLHAKKENKCRDSTYYSLANMHIDHNEGKKPTWLAFDKQVSKLLLVARGNPTKLIFNT